MQIRKINRTEWWCPFLLFFILGFPILFRGFGSGDELWNYNFAISVAEGRLPYADFSIVQTPLSAYFSAFFLFVFGKSLIVFRLAGVVLISLTFALLYIVCKTISGSRLVAYVASCFSYVLVYHIWIYNYNYLILLCVLFLIYETIQKPTKHTGIVIAFIYGLLPLIKQSTGTVLFLLYIGFQLWDVKQENKSLRRLCKEMIFAFVPGTFFVIWLMVSGIFVDFWDYAVKGVSTFTHRTYIWEYMFSTPVGFMVTLFVAVAITMSLYTIVKNKYGEDRKLHIKILLISVAAGVVAYPLTDHYHMMVAMIPYVICLLMCFKPKSYTARQERVCAIIVALILVASSLNVILDVKDLNLCKLNRFEGIPIAENVEANIQLVDEFIIENEARGKRVVIADECAAACMIPLEKYNKNFDMLLIGNIGSNSVADLLSDSQNTIYLITKDEATLGYQAHKELIQYIKDNYSLVGEVAGLDAYEKQD